MKRFFLIPVLALFTCVNMWADPVEVSTIDALQTQLAAGHDVKLMADITITTTKAVSINSTVTLDLNDHRLIANTSNGNMFSFADAASSAVTFTIKNGSITKTSTSTCYYPIRLYNLNNMSVVLEDVTIAEGSKFALLIYTKSKAAGNPSVTIQGTCAIPVIGFGGYSDISLVNVANSTLNTAFKLDSYGTGRTIKLTNNGTLNLGASTQITCNLTKEGTGACTVAPGAEFSDDAWTNLDLADYCTDQGYKIESVVQQNSWTIIKKVRDSNYNPTLKARLNGQDYPSVQVAMAVAYAAGGEQTVTLLADDDYETTAKIMSDADITLDLNHHVLTVKNKIDFECASTYHGKLIVRDGEITSSTSSDIFYNTNTTVTNEKPELILENVIVTNTYHNTEEYLSSRGKCFRTYGFFKLTLSGTTDCPVYLDLYKGISWANYFELTNNTQSKIYVMGYASEYGRSNALSYYITDNTLLDKFGASNTNWEIWQGYIKADIKDTYLSHIKGAVNEEVLEIGPDGEKINAYWITEEGLPVVATVNGTNYYTLADALEASTSDHPAQLAGDVSAATINVRNGNNCYLDLNNHTLTLNSVVSTSQNSVENGQLHFVGTGTVNTSHPFNITGSTNASASNYSVLTIGENVTVNYSTLNNNYPYAIWVAANDSKAYGVRVDLAGTLNSNKSGAYINGTIQASTGNVPVFNIGGTINAKSIGIYAAGYGKWKIIDGASITGAYSAIEMRAGKLTIDGGSFTATATTSSVTPNGNGTTTTGSAISVAQHTTKLPIDVTINGGEFRAIYPIAQYNPQKNETAYVDQVNITVNGGKFWATNTADVAAYTEDNKLSLTGGYYNLAPHAFVANGYVAINNPDKDPLPSVEDGYLFKVVQLVPEDFESTLTEGNWVVEDTWKENESVADHIPTQHTNVTIPDGGNVYVQPTPEEEEVVAYAHNLTLAGNATLKVKAGATLVLGNEATVANTANLVVEAGGQLLIAPSESEVHPVGSVTLIADAAGLKQEGLDDSDPNNLYWQHFAIPTTVAPSIRVEDKDGNEITTPITYYNKWDIVNGWENVLKTNMNTPFQGYNLSNDRVYHSDIRYIFSGPLVGNASNPLVFARRGFSFFGNSYLAPINIRALQAAMYEQGMEYTVYVYVHRNASGPQIYRAINDVTAGIYGIEEIKPLEGFFMFAEEASQADFQYNSAVYSAFLNKQMGGHMVNNAPARNVKPAFDAKAVIAVEAQNGESDEVILVASENFSNDYDLKADARKMENSGVNIYADGAFDDLAVMATNDLMGQTLSFKAGKDALYTMTFSNVEGELALYDKVAGKTIAVAENGTYTFAAQPNTTTAGRFEVVPMAKVPTAIENTEAKANIKGIYSITGMYLGEDFHTLPAGVYVVNGVKIVK